MRSSKQLRLEPKGWKVGSAREFLGRDQTEARGELPLIERLFMNDNLVFASRKEFRGWLIKNAKTGSGVWLVFGKTPQVKTLKASEGLEEALCFGWIDGQMKSVDENHYLKYFAPRRKDSPWSAKNKQLVEKLCQKGLMTELGLAAINQAKNAGTWNGAKTTPDFTALIVQFQVLLKDNQVASENFTKAPVSYQKQIVGFYFDAKQEETKQKRLTKIIAALHSNKRTILY